MPPFCRSQLGARGRGSPGDRLYNIDQPLSLTGLKGYRVDLAGPIEKIQGNTEVLIFLTFETNLLVPCIEWLEKIEFFKKLNFVKIAFKIKIHLYYDSINLYTFNEVGIIFLLPFPHSFIHLRNVNCLSYVSLC